jgi:heat shock protein HtpX
VQPVLVYDRIQANHRKTWLLLSLLALLSLPFLTWLAAYVAELVRAWVVGTEDTNLLEGAVLPFAMAMAVVALLAYLLSTFAADIVLRLSGARPLAEQEEPELRRTLENVCIGAGLPPPRLYLVESPAPNAFATGLEPSRASLAVTRGLLELLDRRELEGVIAHELSHIGNHDTRLIAVSTAGLVLMRLPFTVVVTPYRLLMKLLSRVPSAVVVMLPLAVVVVLPLFITVLFSAVPLSIILAPGDPPQTAVLAFVLIFCCFLFPYYGLFAPILGQFITRAVSRHRTLLADADAFLLTRNTEGLASALAKTAAASDLPLLVGASTAHLYAVDPLRRTASWWNRIFAAHPPIEERIALLSAMGSGIPSSATSDATEAGLRYAAGVDSTDRAARGQTTAWKEGGLRADVEQRAVGFRISGEGAKLYERPDLTSPVLALLPVGSLVTVSGEEADFLRIVTREEKVAYVARTTPMTPVEMGTGPTESPGTPSS